MWVLVTGLGIVFTLHVLWPTFMQLSIKARPDSGEELGQHVWIMAAIFIAIMYPILVCSNPGWNWNSPEAAINSIVATVAIIFGYGQLMPSPFFPAFEQLDLKRVNRLTVQRGQDTTVKLVVHNTGIVSWGQFRIALEAKLEDGIKFCLNVDSNKLGTLRTMSDDTLIQKNADLLAVGAPAVLFFNLKADRVGEFRLRVKVSSGLRPGEKLNRSLRLIVVNATGLDPASQ